jgi:hypothetical protein
MRLLTEHERWAIKKKIFNELDRTEGGQQVVGYLAGLFVSQKRFMEVCLMISREMVIRGELEVVGRTKDGEEVVRRKVTQ